MSLLKKIEDAILMRVIGEQEKTIRMIYVSDRVWDSFIKEVDAIKYPLGQKAPVVYNENMRKLPISGARIWYFSTTDNVLFVKHTSEVHSEIDFILEVVCPVNGYSEIYFPHL